MRIVFGTLDSLDPAQIRSANSRRPDDIYIGIMGVTGTGKSTFIRKCCRGNIDIAIGHSLTSETKDVAVYTTRLNDKNVHLIDTPGFDDTYRSDSDVLQDLAYWLAKSYRDRSIKLTGMIYLHRITDPRMTGNAFKNLKTFQKLCGTESMSCVLLVTTRWEEVQAQAGETRETDLRQTPEFWGDMISHGSVIKRHNNEEASALRILGSLVQRGEGPTVLHIQREMVEQNRQLNETDAGREVEGELRKQRELFERRLKRAEEEMKEALEANDSRYAEQLAREQDKLQNQIKESERGRQELQVSMERLIREKDEQHQRVLQELQQTRESLWREAAERREREMMQKFSDAASVASGYSQTSYAQQPQPAPQQVTHYHGGYDSGSSDAALAVGAGAGLAGGAALAGAALLCSVM